MGKVRTTSVKIISREIIKKYNEHLSLDFDHNKSIVMQVAKVGSKRFRNQIAGYITHQKKLKHLQEQDYEN